MRKETGNEENKQSWFATMKWHIKMTLRNAYYRIKYKKKIEENNAFQDKYEGEACFVIGNGPSLTAEDLNKIKELHFISFASNKIFKLFNDTDWRPDYYAISDPVVYLSNKQIFDSLTLEKFIPLDIFVKNNLDSKDWHVFMRQYQSFPDRFRAFQPDMTKTLGEGWTITYFLLQMAVFMGFKTIYLLGCDFSYSFGIGVDGKVFKDPTVVNYFQNGDSAPDTTPNLQYNYLAYKEARRFADENGITIYNATRGGKLEVYERIDIDKVFKDREEQIKSR